MASPVAVAQSAPEKGRHLFNRVGKWTGYLTARERQYAAIVWRNRGRLELHLCLKPGKGISPKGCVGTGALKALISSIPKQTLTLFENRLLHNQQEEFPIDDEIAVFADYQCEFPITEHGPGLLHRASIHS